MDIRNKVIDALSSSFPIEYVRLEDDDGISGFVVSPRFQDISTLDRQGIIEDALRNASPLLSSQEQRNILMIAGLTPAEYNAVGARIRIHKVKKLARGAVRVQLHGGISDAEYVRGVLKNQGDIQTTEPRQVDGAVGILMFFHAKGTAATPLTKEKIIQILEGDEYIEVMPNA